MDQFKLFGKLLVSVYHSFDGQDEDSGKLQAPHTATTAGAFPTHRYPEKMSRRFAMEITPR
jgi:hypothetical protein